MRENSFTLLPREKTAWKTLRAAFVSLREVIDAGVHDRFEEYVLIAEMEKLLAKNDQRCFYKHLQDTVGMGGKKTLSEHFVWNEDGTLLRDKVHVRGRYACFFTNSLVQNRCRSISSFSYSPNNRSHCRLGMNHCRRDDGGNPEYAESEDARTRLCRPKC